MPKFDSAKLEAVGNSLKIGRKALDPELLDLAISYKKNVAKRYQLLQSNDMKKRIYDDEVYCSVKIDGQFSYIYMDKDEVFIFNYSGRVITGLPLLDELRDLLPAVQSIICPCELYLLNADGRSRVYNVTTALGSAEKLDELKVAIYDLVEVDGESWLEKPYEEVDKKMQEILPSDGRVHKVATQKVKVADLPELYSQWVRKGKQEGMIVRSCDSTVYKVTPRHNIDVLIIGFTEQVDEESMVSNLLCGMMRPDESIQIIGRVGTGFSEQQRSEMFELFKPHETESLYKETDGNHTLFTFIKPMFIAEIAFHDLIAEHSDASPVMKAVLNFENNTGYDVMMPEAFVAMISPVFVQLRDDKSVNPTDLRLSQLQPYVDLQTLNRESRRADLAQSAIIKRKVFTKTTKDLVSIRKFMYWKTNKHELNPEYPP